MISQGHVSRDRFLCSVHQALLENAEDVAPVFLANIADSALAPDDEDEPSQIPGTSVDADDTPDDAVLDESAAQALAVIGLDHLLNW